MLSASSSLKKKATRKQIRQDFDKFLGKSALKCEGDRYKEALRVSSDSGRVYAKSARCPVTAFCARPCGFCLCYISEDRESTSNSKLPRPNERGILVERLNDSLNVSIAVQRVQW